MYYINLAIEILLYYKYAFLMLAVAFSFKGLMDVSGRDGFVNNWFNKSKSWQNKYAKGLKPNYKHWYYLGLITTKYKEKFIFSSTALVFITDGWHLFQFFFLNAITLAFMLGLGHSIEEKIIVGMIVELIYAIHFNLTYNNGSSSNGQF